MTPIRLTMFLSEHSVGAEPETFALLALMHLHAARLGSGLNEAGGLCLLRSKAGRCGIARGSDPEWSSCDGQPTVMCFLVFTRKPASPLSIAWPLRLPKGSGDEIADVHALLERAARSPLRESSLSQSRNFRDPSWPRSAR
jgi:hypothetical protein